MALLHTLKRTPCSCRAQTLSAVNQLIHNDYGFPFYVKLFPALMQGEKTEESVIAVLDRIYAYCELFDVVVLIRTH